MFSFILLAYRPNVDSRKPDCSLVYEVGDWCKPASFDGSSLLRNRVAEALLSISTF